VGVASGMQLAPLRGAADTARKSDWAPSERRLTPLRGAADTAKYTERIPCDMGLAPLRGAADTAKGSSVLDTQVEWRLIRTLAGGVS
jgi:hypothetical protein